jgi:hypothetical protein
MGKVAADNSHKWVYREPMEHEISFISPWHGSLDPVSHFPPHSQALSSQFALHIVSSPMVM